MAQIVAHPLEPSTARGAASRPYPLSTSLVSLLSAYQMVLHLDRAALGSRQSSLPRGIEDQILLSSCRSWKSRPTG
jgi:hypothetical protein